MVFNFRSLTTYIVSNIESLPLNPLTAWKLRTTQKSVTGVHSKPVIRNLLRTQIRNNIITAFAIAGLCGYSYKYFVGDVRKRRYAEFYRDYDAEKEFDTMRKKGVFQSC